MSLNPDNMKVVELRAALEERGVDHKSLKLKRQLQEKLAEVLASVPSSMDVDANTSIEQQQNGVQNVKVEPPAVPTSTEPPPPPDKPKTVETFAREVGIIEPPPDLRGYQPCIARITTHLIRAAIVDRTADFVKRNGPQFEQEIRARNLGKVRTAVKNCIDQ